MVEDSGKYLCMVNNSVGGESVETVLTVTGKKNNKGLDASGVGQVGYAGTLRQIATFSTLN
jgi:hypothetical protein